MKRFSQLTQTATEADLVAGKFLAIDVPGAGGMTKKLPGDCVAGRRDILSKIGLTAPIFELGNIYFDTWNYAASTSRVRTDKDNLVVAHRGGRISLSDYTNAQIHIGYKDSNGNSYNTGWLSGDYTFEIDCGFAVLIRYVVGGVETAIPDGDVSLLSSLFSFVDTASNAKLIELHGENKTSINRALSIVGAERLVFSLGGIYFNQDTPWSNFVTSSRVRTDKDNLISAHAGAVVGLKDYTNTQFYVGYKDSAGKTHNSGWMSSDYTIPEDSAFAVEIKYLVGGVETTIPNFDVDSVGNLLVFNDVAIQNSSIYNRTKQNVSLVGMLRQGRLNSSTGAWEYGAKDAVSTFESIFFKALPVATKLKFNFTNPANRQLRVRVAWWKADGTSNGTTGTYQNAANEITIKANTEYFSLSFIIYDTQNSQTVANICPADVDAYGVNLDCIVGFMTFQDRKILDSVDRPYRYSGERIQVNKWNVLNRLNVPLTSNTGSSCQSMVILGDKIVILVRETGTHRGAVFSLATQTLIATFDLPHTGLENPHCNMSSARLDGDDIILYTDQFYGEKLCLVYRLDASNNYTPSLIQTIGSNSDNQGAGPRDWFVDFFNNKIYSVGYKLDSDAGDPNTNTSFVSKFELPAIDAGDVMFTNEDVLDNFEVALPTYRQDCECIGDKIILAYGLGSTTPTGVCVLNLVNHTIESNVDFSVLPSYGEPEGIAVNDNGNIYFMYSADNNIKRLFV